MADYWDVVQWKKTKSGKQFTVRLGSATKDEKTGGWRLYMNALPVPTGDGECQVNIIPPREKWTPGQSKDASRNDARERDEVPF